MLRFVDRVDAGRRLAARMDHLGLVSPVVLGLPRGGIPVAAEVAAALRVPVGVFVARKLNAPGRQELGIGAVAEGLGKPVVSPAAHQLGLSAAELDMLVERARAELARRVSLYRAGRPLPTIGGKDVVLVDDGLATGVTAEAALRALRDRRPKRLVLAVPVCAREPADRLATVADFSQTTEEEVLSLLEHNQAR
jgi:putative phosphoribosyl transferase